MSSTDYKKYPRTYHLPFSKGLQSDDKMIQSLDNFIGKNIVVCEKLDGENTTIYPDGHSHARSIDSKSHWSRDVVKRISAQLRYEIPEGHRLCCENMEATHSIYYPDYHLEGPLYLLSVWNDDICLSWEDTCTYAQLLDLPQPKVFYSGIFDLDVFKKIAEKLDTSIEEGFVVRLVESFSYDDFSKSVTKYVREGHVQENAQHWIKSATPNGKYKSPVKPSFLNYSSKLKF